MLKARVFLTLGVLTLLISSLPAFFTLSSRAGDLQWTRLNIPADGVSGNWLLADGSDIRHLTLAADGTLYCCADPSGTQFRLFKSADGGLSWAYTGRVQSEIVDIAVSPSDPEIVYYATSASVYRSADAGNNFDSLALSPGGAGNNGLEIVSIDVTSFDDSQRIAAGVCDRAEGRYGGVYLLDESLSEDWVDLEIGSYDVYCVAFSPRYASDRQIVAVASNETDTVVTTDINGMGWGNQAGDARLHSLKPLSAAIAFPEDYNADVASGQYIQFIALDSGSGLGGVYRLEARSSPAASEIIDLNAGSREGAGNRDIASLAVKGQAAGAFIMAGMADAAGLYLSEDGGSSWNLSVKNPTGDSDTCVLMADDFSTSRKACAATCGTESAFSISRDGGITWDQSGLIDTRITHILDLAVSPAFASDGTLFLVTADLEHSLWRSWNAGANWERIFSSALPPVDRIKGVKVSPSYQQNGIVLVNGASEGRPVIWRSTDSGDTCILTYSVDPDTGKDVNIYAWAISPEDVVFVGGFDGEKCVVYQSGEDSLAYVDKAEAGSSMPASLALSPDFSRDQAVLLGDINGNVYYSADHGCVFEPLPLDAQEAPLDGTVSVAFDSNFGQNHTVYASGGAGGEGIFRFVIGSSFEWEPIDDTLPQGAQVSRISVSDAGVLYGIYSRDEINIENKGGLERSLYPCSPSPCFESITAGLGDGIEMNGLWVRDNTLWSVDITSTEIMVYTDLLVSPVELESPPDGAAGLEKSAVQISWQVQEGAAGYQWQIDTDDKFAGIPAGCEGETDSTLVNLPSLDENTVYFWRVRVNSPALGPWSEIRSFDTFPGLEVPKLSSPGSGSRSSLQPVFKWSLCEGAECYDLVVAGDESFSEEVIHKCGDNACNSNVWKCDRTLKYDTDYYWKVRAVQGDKTSQWSSPGIFTTQKKSSGSSSGGGSAGSGSSSTPAPTPSPSQTAESTSAPASSPSPAPSLSETAASLPVSDPTNIAAPSPSNTPGPPGTGLPYSPAAVTSAAATPSSGPLPSGDSLPVTSVAGIQSLAISGEAGSSNSRLLIILCVVLAVLLAGMTFIVVYLYRKLRRY
ncbi:MAG: hypothetical protein JXA46_14475 [Dehalococcoidales bacterium]|nr:hypothetical protein [Dehalococcoidales bacterium]